MGKVTLPLAATLFAVPENVAATDYVCTGLREITSVTGSFEEEGHTTFVTNTKGIS